MKKLIAMLLVGGLLAAGVVGCGPAATTGNAPKVTPPKVTPPDDKNKETTTMGKVSKIDKKAVTVKDDKDKETTVMVGADTKITLDGKDAKIDDLKEGQAVTVKAKGDAVTSIDAKGAAAVTPPPATETTTMGKVSKIDKKAVTVKDDKDKETTVMVGADTKITLDGKDAKIDDLKEGQAVTVKAKGDAVTSIDAKGAAAPPPPPPPDNKPVSGKVTKSADGKVTLSVDGKDKAFEVPDGAKVTIDGKDAKAADIKAADATTATITTDKDGKVTTVEVKTK